MKAGLASAGPAIFVMVRNDFDPEYIRYIKSDTWKRRCELYFLKNGRWCRGCRTTKGPIQVHHMSYDRLGREPMADLIGVCSKCHRGIHALHRKNGRRISLRDATMLYIRGNRV